MKSARPRAYPQHPGKTPIGAPGGKMHDSLTRNDYPPAMRGTYGDRTESRMRDILEIMWQRHSCRAAFDPQRGIRESDMQRILDAVRWAPTAHNKQNFEVIAVDDKHC